MKYAKADLNGNIPVSLQEATGLFEVPPPMANAVEDISVVRNRQDPTIKFQTDIDTTLRDFYWKYARGLVPRDMGQYIATEPAQVEKLDAATQQAFSNKYFYELSLTNKGGLPMPVIIEWTYGDGTKEIERISAQVWRYNEKALTKAFMKDKQVTGIRIDPLKETSDVNDSNNSWGNVPQTPTRFQVFKAKQNSSRGQSTGINAMQKEKEKTGY